MSITLNRDGYKQVIEDDIDFLNRHFPKELQSHLSYFHTISVLEHSVEYLYKRRERMTDKTTLREFISRLEELSDRGKNDNLEVGIESPNDEFCPVQWFGIEEYFPQEELEENNPQHPTKCIMIQY